MSYKWPPKDPDELLDFSVDWSRYLDTATIVTVAWSIIDSDGTKTAFTNGSTVNGLQLVAQTNTNTVATINLGLGTLNKEYTLYCAIQTSIGTSAERSIRLKIKEQ